jgi:hypothetical protein
MRLLFNPAALRLGPSHDLPTVVEGTQLWPKAIHETI